MGPHKQRAAEQETCIACLAGAHVSLSGRGRTRSAPRAAEMKGKRVKQEKQ